MRDFLVKGNFWKNLRINGFFSRIRNSFKIDKLEVKLIQKTFLI